MNILYWGTFDPATARNRILIQGLRDNGVQVDVVNLPAWKGLGEGASGAGAARVLRLLWL